MKKTWKLVIYKPLLHHNQISDEMLKNTNYQHAYLMIYIPLLRTGGVLFIFQLSYFSYLISAVETDFIVNTVVLTIQQTTVEK